MAASEGINNYYESLVIAQVEERGLGDVYDEDTLRDLLCTALNQLPARYIVSSLALTYYTQPEERAAMLDQVNAAIDYARYQISKRV